MSEQIGEDAPSRAPITNYGQLITAPPSSNVATVLGMVAAAQAADWRRRLEEAVLEAVATGCGVLVLRREGQPWTAEASPLIPALTVVAVDEAVTAREIREELARGYKVQAKDLEQQLKRPASAGFGDIFGAWGKADTADDITARTGIKPDGSAV